MCSGVNELPLQASSGPYGAAQLAIVVGSLGAVSETFIEMHIRDLAPGQTIIMCTGATSSAVDRVIRLPSPQRAGMMWPARKLLGALEWARSGRPRSFDRQQEAAAVRALQHAGVTKVLAEYGPLGCAVAAACKTAGADLFVHFHGFDASVLLRDRIWLQAYRRLACDALGFIAPSRYLADRLAAVGFPPDRLHVIPCGIDPAEFPVPLKPAGGQRVLAVGRLVEKKAPDLLIAAFAVAAASHPGATLEIIGDGPLMDRCRKEVRDLGLAERVVLHGARSHAFVRERMQVASVFAQHSVTASNGDTEGLGVAILEAMVSGLPVVSTRHDGIPETVLEGETGLLVDERDIVGMGRAIRALLSDPEHARVLGDAGRARALAHFTRTTSIARLREVMRLRIERAETPSGPRRAPPGQSAGASCGD
jgi:colanic acid/amylovoran biosynthesis glycosyltransferase